jgi:hypothetical protein
MTRMHTVTGFISGFQEKGWESEPHDALLWFITQDRDALLPLARWMLGAMDTSRNLVPDLLSHLTEQEFGSLLEEAVILLDKKGLTESLEEVFRHAALQVPAALGPHLSLLAADPDLQGIAPAWRAAESPRSVTLGPCHHIFFSGAEEAPDPGYVESLRRCHPTAQLTSEHDIAGTAGGVLAQRCSRCHNPLHAILRLSELPAGFGVSVRPFTLAICGQCLWGTASLFYAHGADGDPSSRDESEAATAPYFASAPLPVGPVRASPTPDRWVVQDWGVSNSRQNLHRLGGRPSWVQDPDYPTCPHCQAVMPFLLQLDGGGRLPAMPPGEGWNEDGLMYVFWCDGCRISAVIFQNT